jgi:hypothetical protein
VRRCRSTAWLLFLPADGPACTEAWIVPWYCLFRLEPTDVDLFTVMLRAEVAGCRVRIVNAINSWS